MPQVNDDNEQHVVLNRIDDAIGPDPNAQPIAAS